MRSLPLALLLLLAGCADPPASDPGPTPPSPEGDGAPATAPEPAPVPPAPAVVVVAEPYEASGKTWTSACASTPAGSRCQDLVEGSDPAVLFPEGWDLAGLELQLTWTGGNDRMGFGIVREHNGTLVGDPAYYVDGTSPLAIAFDLTPLAGQRLGFHVGSYAAAGAAGVHASASPGQEWRLAGDALVRRTA